MNTELKPGKAPSIGQQCHIKLVGERFTRPCTVTAITEPDRQDRVTYTAEVDEVGTCHGSCHKNSTPFYPL